MSLLMDALKKAEEAKQQASNKSDAGKAKRVLNENVKREISKSEKMLDDLSLLHDSASKLSEKQANTKQEKNLELSLEPKKDSLTEQISASNGQEQLINTEHSASQPTVDSDLNNQTESAKLILEIEAESDLNAHGQQDQVHVDIAARQKSTQEFPAIGEPARASRMFSVSKNNRSRRPTAYTLIGVGLISIVSGMVYFNFDALSRPNIITKPGVATLAKSDPQGEENNKENNEPSATNEIKNRSEVEAVALDKHNTDSMETKNSAEIATIAPDAIVAEIPKLKPKKVAVTPPALPKPKALKPKQAGDEVVKIKQTADSKTEIKSKPIIKPKAKPFVPVNIVKQEITDPTLTQLEQAYQSYQSGDTEKAQNMYTKVVVKEPSNRDARLGLAAIAMQNGNLALAHRHYKYLLRINPKDSVALSGVMSAITGANALKSESQIKLLLDQEPQAAHLHFTLGNLLAAQTRWSDAQQSYFQAYRFDPDNADYAFNLAVSLDYLGEQKTALEYYEKSIVLSRNRNVSFDKMVAQKRINSLTSK